MFAGQTSTTMGDKKIIKNPLPTNEQPCSVRTPCFTDCLHNLQNALFSRLLLKPEKLSEQGSKVQILAVSEAGKSDEIFGGEKKKGKPNLLLLTLFIVANSRL